MGLLEIGIQEHKRLLVPETNLPFSALLCCAFIFFGISTFLSLLCFCFDLTLFDNFNLQLEYFLPNTDPQGQSALPPTPTVNPAVLQPVQQASLLQTGLTPSEQALLSPEEQAIKLRQRGLA